MRQRQNIIYPHDNLNTGEEIPGEPDTWQHIAQPIGRVVERIAPRSGRYKFGPQKKYDPHELALFAEYRTQREEHRPLACNPELEHCWVKCGPVGWTSSGINGRCLACRGSPRLFVIAGRPPRSKR